MPASPSQRNQQLLDKLKKMPPGALSAASMSKSMAAVSRKAVQAIVSRAKIKGVPWVGRVCNFRYDAKHKETLPYWDANPVVIPIKYYSDGFLGLNFHYLDPYNRALLLDRLIAAFESTPSERTRLTLSYELLKGVSNLRMFKPCLKRYLSGHVKSQFMEIDREDWFQVVLLPLARFQKASEGQVHRDSRKRM